MTDPAAEILAAFETALNGKLTNGSDNWPVYLSKPKSEGRGYVVLSDLNWYDDGGDDDMDCSLTIEINNGTPTIGQVLLAPMNAIASTIVSLVSKIDISMTSYKMRVLPYIESNDLFWDESSYGAIPRKVLRIRFICRKK